METRGAVDGNTQQPYTKLIINLDANAGGVLCQRFVRGLRKIEMVPKVARRLRFRVSAIGTFYIAPPRYNAIANIDDTACRYIGWRVNIARQLLVPCIFHPYRHLVRRRVARGKKYVQKRMAAALNLKVSRSLGRKDNEYTVFRQTIKR